MDLSKTDLKSMEKEELIKLIGSIEERFAESNVNAADLVVQVEELNRELTDVNAEMQKIFATVEREKNSFSNLLNNMKQAVFCVGKDCKIMGPVSRCALTVFEEKIEGKNVFDTIFRELRADSEQGSLIYSTLIVVMGEDDLQWGLMEVNLPKRLTYTGPESGLQKHLKIDYIPIWSSDEKMEHLLFVVDDLTEVESLEREYNAQKQMSSRNLQIIQELAANGIDELGSFFNSSLNILAECNNIVGSEGINVNKLKTLLKSLHTLKGNARLYNMSTLSTEIHQTESQISSYIIEADTDDSELGELDKAHLTDHIQRISGELHEYLFLAKKIFKLELDSEKLGIVELFQSMSRLEALLCLQAGEDENINRVIYEEVRKILSNQRKIADILNAKRIREDLLALEETLKEKKERTVEIICGYYDLMNHAKEIYFGSSCCQPYGCTTTNLTPLIAEATRMTFSYKLLTADKVDVAKINENLLNFQRSSYEVWSRCMTAGFEFLSLLSSKIRIARPQGLPAVGNHPGEEAPESDQIINKSINLFWVYIALVFRLDSEYMLTFESRVELISALRKLYKAGDTIESEWDKDQIVSELENIKVGRTVLLSVLTKLAREGIHPSKILELLGANLLEYEYFRGKNFDVIDLVVGAQTKHCDYSPIVATLNKNTPPEEVATYLKYFAGDNSQVAMLMDILYSEKPVGTIFTMIVDFKKLLDAFKEGDLAAQCSITRTIEIVSSNYDRLKQAVNRAKTSQSKLAHAKLPASMTQGYAEAWLSEIESAFTHMLDVSVTKVFSKFSNMVEELSKNLWKQVRLRVSGDEVTLHRDKLYKIQDAIVHILRNAIDHGIEAPEARLKAGKDEYGTINIECQDRGASEIAISIKDDGRGIDTKKLVKKALDKNIMSQEQLACLSEKEKVELIYLPQLSTKDEVTDLSGRGIGMSAVKSLLQEIGGRIEINNRPGSGTEFLLIVNNS